MRKLSWVMIGLLYCGGCFSNDKAARISGLDIGIIYVEAQICEHALHRTECYEKLLRRIDKINYSKIEDRC